ncbi:patatin [Lutibacter sp. HS1-25]|nr:patatin [Lutibacter sp. HS1-25]
MAILLCIPIANFAQEKKPKVALVLSGGGAKGIAHIPLLQKLDSLGIVPDMVLGTSMGSLVGGLYAMGYSGDSIASIADTANWDFLLGGSVALTEVSVEEKSEFNRYLIDLDLKNGKPKAKPELLNDQNLREFLGKLTYPVYNVTDFDKLSIPFRAMATDIVNGKEIIMDKGSLPLAMRASMSIPTIFKAVPYNGTLLVDGGMLNNFPTDVALKLGADIIIGSDVSGGMANIEDLEKSMTAIMFQAGMLNSNLKNPLHKKNATILIDHVPNLTYSTGDFNKSKEIYKQGKTATNLNLDALIALAEQLKKYPKKEHKIPEISEKFKLDTISYTGISKGNLDLVKARINIKTNKTYTVDDIIEGINRAMGTNLFNQITTNYISTDDKIGIQINGFEHTSSQVKGALHYDTYRGVGILANYTGRNILGDASRILATVDIAEQPRIRVEYQKIFSGNRSWWWNSEVYGEHLQQKIFIDGNLADDMKYRSFQFDNQINKNFNSLKSYMGFGINYQHTKVRPKKDPQYSDNVYKLDFYKFEDIELNAQYVYNTINEAFYATNGTFFHATVARSILQNTDFAYYQDEFPAEKGNTNGYTKLALNFETRFPFNQKTTGIVSATGSFIFQDKLKENDLSFSDYGYAEKYFVGGSLLIPKKDSYTFPGLYEGELNVSEFLKLSLGTQFTPFHKVYITPNFNIAAVGNGTFNEYIDDILSPGNNWQDAYKTSLLMSAGATLSYNSLLGPVNFDLSWVNNINKVRVFFSVGFVFNPSIR